MKTDHHRRRIISLAMLLSLMLSSLSTLGGMLPTVTAAPPTVTVAGSLQSEAGCPGDWDPGCSTTFMTYSAGENVYRFSKTLPAGNYEYKAALNGGWAENYGKNAQSNGANINLNLPNSTTVNFYYSPVTHWITDSVNSTIATAAGSFQSELGCPGDWQPSCLNSWLQDPDGDGIYTFETTAIPAGNYEFKVALNEKWDEAYPGGNVSLTVPKDGVKVKFSFNAATKAISWSAGHGLDNNVEYDGLGHNSQDPLYRQPFGAVNPGTAIKLRFRTFANDVSAVKVRFYDTASSQESFQNMKISAKAVSCYEERLAKESCDWWETSYTPSKLTTIYYRFIIADGTTTAYYADDKFKDGGWGEATPGSVDNSYVVTVFDPQFKPISWMQNAVIYQIFPDRFFNGEKENDPNPNKEPRYGWPIDTLDKILVKKWNELPEGYCRAYKNPAQPCNENPRGRDYFGGDLKGVTEKLGYLSSLGVNTIYFNPIFESASDHGYDTQNYFKIDHFFGTQEDWKDLVSEAKDRNMRIVLDGVFNHVSSDSPYFDRYGHFPEVGACESPNSPYRSWFYFKPKAGGPCAGPDGPNTMDYDAWFGFDSLPVLNKNAQGVRDLVYAQGNKSVAPYWLNNGAAAWRLDVMGDGSFPDEFWQQFRTAVKSAKSDASIIGELWKKEEMLPKIHGDMADSTMNYRFRNAILGFFGTVDNKGFADDGATNQPPSMFARKLNSVREDYPDAVYYTLMNLMDSHDTMRILWNLTPGQNNREDKEFNQANVAKGKALLRLAALVQMTIPGAPTIYYGDEVGLTGDDDPDDRRTFPWANGSGEDENSKALAASADADLMLYYRNLIKIRKNTSELKNGELKFLLLDDANTTMAYAMREASGNRVSIVAINRSESPKTLTIPLKGYLRDGVNFRDSMANNNVTSANGSLTITLPALGGTVLTSSGLIKGPDKASSLSAQAGNGKVTLNWTKVASAQKYNVYRTQVSGGGYELIAANLSTLTYTDSTVVNGKRYYYIVRGVDNLGNEGVASNEAGATPAFPIGYAVIQWPYDITIAKSIDGTPNVYGQVYVAGLTDAGAPNDSILAQIGFGTPGSNPMGWNTWTDMSFNNRQGNNYEYTGKLVPEVTGTFDLLVRYSDDNGITWTYGYLPGNSPNPGKPLKLVVNPNADTVAPAAPGNLKIADWSASFIKLSWNAVSDAAQYRVYRSTTVGVFDFNNPIAKVSGTSFTDDNVGVGSTYYYVVRAYDAALNASANSNQVSQKAEPKLVAVTFRVKVPAGMPAGDTVYIPGSIDQFGPWNPGKQALTNKGNNIWEVTVNILDGTTLQYKYTRGSWDRVEWWGSIISTANREVSVSYGANGTQLVDDTGSTGPAVQAWRDPYVVQTTAGAANVLVKFNRAIQPDGANYSQSVVVTKAGAAVAGTVAASGTDALIWTPGAALTSGTYTVTVNKVKSSLGGDSIAIQNVYTFTFTV